MRKFPGAHITVTSTAALVGTVLAAAPLFAQTASEVGKNADNTAQPTIDEIVVAARKQSESLVTVPVAVSVISGEQLDRVAANSLTKFAELVPQVKLFQGAGGGGASFAIRGLGSSFLDGGVEQTVSVAIDGVQVGRGNIIQLAFFDTQQVEVLKGPQALFFGKNSPAGVVSITTQDPGDYLSGYVRGGYEFVADERYIEGASSLPISDTLAIRVAGRASAIEGFLLNDAQPQPYFFNATFTSPGAPHRRQPHGSDQVGRLTAVWDPSSDFTARIKVTAGHFENDDPGGAYQAWCFAPATTTSALVRGVSYPDPTGDCAINEHKSTGTIPREIAAGIPGMRDGQTFMEQDTVLASLPLEYQAGPLTLSSVTGYSNIHFDSAALSDRTSLSLVPSSALERNNTYSQELRAVSNFDGPLNFTVGGYAERARFTTGVSTLLAYAGIDPATGKYSSADRQSRNNNRAYSLFGQARWNLLDNVELAGGLRWTRETKHVRTVNTYVHPGVAPFGIFIPQGVIIDGRLSDSNVSPEVTVTWHPRSQMTLYAAYKTGYKSGGISNPTILTAGLNAANLKFDSEEAQGGEIGFKVETPDRTFRGDVIAYRYRYDNLQVSSFDAATTSFLIQNAAAATIQGVEGAINWTPLSQLTLQAAVGYNRARFTSYPDAPCGTQSTGACAGTRFYDLSGAPLARAPDWTGLVGATYDAWLSESIGLAFNADVDFSSSYLTQENENPLARQSAFTRLNMGIRLHGVDDRWELAVIGRNLTNKYVVAFTTDRVVSAANQFNAAIYRPRQITAQATFRF